MKSTELKESLRIALSHGEKARALERECDQAFASGKVDRAHRESLARFYTEHMRLAEREAARLRREARTFSERLEGQLRRLRRDLESLLRETPANAEAARRNARHATEATRLESEIARLRGLENTRDVADLGGFMDLPLEQYAGAQPGVRAKKRPWFNWRVVAIEFVITVAVFSLIAAVLLPRLGFELPRLGPGAVALDCSARLLDPERGPVQLAVENRGDVPVDLYVPWLAGYPGALDRDALDKSFGLSMEVKERGSDGFRMLPMDATWCKYRGLPLQSGQTITIRPGLSAEITIDMGGVLNTGVPAEAIGLLLTRGTGERVRNYELELPTESTFASESQTPPRQAARPPQIAQTATGPGAQPQTPGSTEPTAGQPATEQPRQSEQPEEPAVNINAFKVRFLGSVGGKIALSVAAPNQERPKRITVELEDEIAPRWHVKAVKESPSAIVVRNMRTGQEVTVERGKEATSLEISPSP